MGIALNTAGILVGYATGTLTSKPTSYKEIPDIKSTPDFNVEPNGLDCTVLSETVAKQYIEGLKDYGSSIQFIANLTKTLIDVWDPWCEAVKTAQATDANACGWIEITHPKLEKAVAIAVTPVALGMPPSEVDSVWEATLFATPLKGAEWITKIAITPNGENDTE